MMTPECDGYDSEDQEAVEELYFGGLLNSDDILQESQQQAELYEPYEGSDDETNQQSREESIQKGSDDDGSGSPSNVSFASATSTQNDVPEDLQKDKVESGENEGNNSSSIADGSVMGRDDESTAPSSLIQDDVITNSTVGQDEVMDQEIEVSAFGKEAKATPSSPSTSQLASDFPPNPSSDTNAQPKLSNKSRDFAPESTLCRPPPVITTIHDPRYARFHELLKSVPYLTIPYHFGFSRAVITSLAEPHGKVSYLCEHHHTYFYDMKSVHTYLSEREIPLPISCFTFEPNVKPAYQHTKKCWEKMTIKEDLSEGLETIPIPVICPKDRKPEKFARYVKNVIADEFMKIPSVCNDDGFLICCECPNDCRDKLKCPCFLKTLDNCSKRTRNEVGDENIGYQCKRLYRQFMSGIFECNRTCKCRKETCLNRVAQNGIVWRLQLFMTDHKGWGVRTLGDIPKGAFICIYAGDVVDKEYADKVSKNWSKGLWKYLSELSVGEEAKEGYEPEVVEPVSPHKYIEGDDSSLEDLMNGSEDVQVTGGDDFDQISGEDWNNFLNVDDIPSSSTPSTSAACQKQRRVAKKKNEEGVFVATPSKRALRSSEVFEEAPKSCEMLETGRMRLLKTSLNDMKILCDLNYTSEQLSEVCIAPNKRPDRRKKMTRHIFLEDFNKLRSEDLYYKNLTRKKEGEKRNWGKRKEILDQSRLLTSQHIIENVLKSMKLKNDDDDLPWTEIVQKIHQRRHQVHWKMKCKANVRKVLLKIRSNLRSIHQKKIKKEKRRKRKRLLFHPKRKLSSNFVSSIHPLLKLDFNIDGYNSGNIGRYMNHSCEANMFPQFVYVNSHDLRFPDIALFAERNISAGEELTWDYKYEEKGDDEDKSTPTDSEDSESPMFAPSRDKGSSNPRTKRVGQQRGKEQEHTQRLSEIKARLPCFCGEDGCRRKIC